MGYKLPGGDRFLPNTSSTTHYYVGTQGNTVPIPKPVVVAKISKLTNEQGLSLYSVGAQDSPSSSAQSTEGLRTPPTQTQPSASWHAAPAIAYASFSASTYRRTVRCEHNIDKHDELVDTSTSDYTKRGHAVSAVNIITTWYYGFTLSPADNDDISLQMDITWFSAVLTILAIDSGYRYDTSFENGILPSAIANSSPFDRDDSADSFADTKSF